jgi:hypothetical protein
MAKIVLRFPKCDGGEEEGLNNPGTETFKGRIGEYLARECAQNTTDAAYDGCAELRFSLLDIRVSELPCAEEVKAVLKACEDYWHADEKARRFFSKAQTFLCGKTVKVLRVSDFNTTGLSGSDDDKQGKWYGLVRSSGVSNKGQGAAGSFGIGKFAHFAASGIQTVYYATRADEGPAFQGIVRLATYLDSNGDKKRGTGYICKHDPNDNNVPFQSLRNDEIPRMFCRTERGTDIYIPAYLPAYDEPSRWSEKLLFSIINNFWLSVHLEKIRFRIGDTVIAKSNIDEIVHKYKYYPEFEAERFYDAYRNGQVFRKYIDDLGEVEFRITERKHTHNPPVAYARASGMTIGTWGYFRSRKPFSGVFICHGKEGNEILRQMEPPRHDSWDPNRRADGQTIINAIKAWIRECITEMFPVGEADRFELDALSRYLPADDVATGEDSFDEAKQRDNKDGFESQPTKPQKNFSKTVVTPPNAADEEGEGRQATREHGESGGGKEGPGEGGIDPKPGDNKDTGGRPRATLEGEQKGDARTMAVRYVSCRSFYESADASYCVILRTKRAFGGRIAFAAECDDGSIAPLTIEKATFESGREIEISQDKRALEIQLEADTVTRCRIRFEEKEKMSLRIVG